MINHDRDTAMWTAACECVRRLGEKHDNLPADELESGFVLDGDRISLAKYGKGIHKPPEMQYLLSIKTRFLGPGEAGYDDQRDVLRQISEGAKTVEYDFHAGGPEAEGNRWLREAFENKVPVIYFLGTAPRHYQALPVLITEWDPDAGETGKALVEIASGPSCGSTPTAARTHVLPTPPCVPTG